MPIARASEKNRRKPHRSGMGWPVGLDAAPTGLGWITGREVSIHRSLRWGLALAGARMERPGAVALRIRLAFSMAVP